MLKPTEVPRSAQPNKNIKIKLSFIQITNSDKDQDQPHGNTKKTQPFRNSRMNHIEVPDLPAAEISSNATPIYLDLKLNISTPG